MKLVSGFGIHFVVGLIISLIILTPEYAPFLKSEIHKNPNPVYGTTLTESDPWPTPDSMIGGIPVYHRFDHMKALFGFDNDTTYIINFWATWCKPCIEELPLFESLHSDPETDKIKIILVSLDFADQVESTLIPFVQKQPLKSTVVLLLDSHFNEWIDEISPDWSGAIPATYIYKRDQNRLVQTKFKNLDELKESIKPFL